MDAAKALKFSLIVSLLLLITVTVSAQTLTVTPSSLTVCSTGPNAQVNITSSPSGASFTVSSNRNWLGVVGSAAGATFTTPQTLTVGVVYQAGTYPTGILTFSPVGGGTATTLTVDFGSTCSGGGGSSGSFTASPTSLSLATNTTTSATVALTNSASTNTDYTSAVSDAWLTVTPATGTVGAGGTTNISIAANSTGLTNGVHTGTVTITPSGGAGIPISVSFNILNGLGTLTVNGSSTLTVNWVYNADSGTLPTDTWYSVLSSAGAASYTALVTSGSNWLGVNHSSIANGVIGSAGNNLLLTAMPGMSSLSTGTYTGSIQITASDTSTATINVNLTVNGGSASTVTIVPPNYTFYASASGSVQTKQIDVVASGGTTLQAPTVPASDTWIAITTTGTAFHQTITVTVTPPATNGTYTSYITVPSSAGSSSVAITLVVGSGGGSGTLGGVVPGSLSFAYQAGSGLGGTYLQYIAITGTAAGYSASANQSWISLMPASGSIPGSLAVYVYPSGLPAGSYSGKVTITSNGASVDVPVSLLVTASGGSPVLNLFSQGDVVFPAPNGSMNPVTMILTGSDGSTPAASVTVSSNTSWLSAQLLGTALTVSANPTGYATGTYSGTVTITAPGYANTPLTVPVVLVVNGGGGSANLTFSALNLFSVASNGAPSSQTLSVTAPSASTVYTVTTSTASGGNWLALNVASGTSLTGNTNLTVTVNPASLTTGSYSGTITFTTGGNVQTVPVNVTVTGPAQTTITVTNGSGTAVSNLNFTYQPGGTLPSQELFVSNVAQGSAGISVTVSTSQSWLKAAFTGGATTAVTQARFTVTIDSTGLTSGSYNGNVTLTPATGAVVTLPVVLTVSASGISATPSSLTFSYQAGQNAPPAQNLTVSSGTSSMNFTVTSTTTSGGAWLSTNPASGATGTSGTFVAVKVDPSALSVGSYTGTVSIQGTTGLPVTVNISLTVTAPTPTISRVLNAASFASGPISPGEIVAIFAPEDGTHPIGPATAAVLTGDMIVNGKLPTQLGGVQVYFNGYLAPLSYAGSGQVNAVVPYEVGGILTPSVWVKFLGQTSNALPLTAADAAPAIFTANRQGTGPGAILNADMTYNAPNNPAAKGSTVAFYVTGEGATAPASTTGQVTTLISTTPARTPQPLLPLGVTIDGQPVTVAFYGEAPGYVAGLMQLNVVIPAGARSGDLPLAVNIGGKSTQASVTVSVR